MGDATDLIKSDVLAADWGLSPRTLNNWRSRRIGPPYVKINGAVRYSRRACSEWLARENELRGIA